MRTRCCSQEAKANSKVKNLLEEYSLKMVKLI